jgi:hypothetical protein
MEHGLMASTTQMIQRVKMSPSQRTIKIHPQNFIAIMTIPKKNTKNWMPMTQGGWMTWTSFAHPESRLARDIPTK